MFQIETKISAFFLDILGNRAYFIQILDFPLEMSLAAQFQQIVGERIKMRRRELHLTQSQLSERLHISRAQVANVEAGSRRIPAFQLARMAEALEIPIEQLVPSIVEAQKRLEQAQRVSLLAEKRPKLLSGELEALNISIDSGATLKKAMEEVQRRDGDLEANIKETDE